MVIHILHHVQIKHLHCLALSLEMLELFVRHQIINQSQKLYHLLIKHENELRNMVLVVFQYQIILLQVQTQKSQQLLRLILMNYQVHQRHIFLQEVMVLIKVSLIKLIKPLKDLQVLLGTPALQKSVKSLQCFIKKPSIIKKKFMVHQLMENQYHLILQNHHHQPTTKQQRQKKENFFIRDERYENGYISGDRTDYPGYQNQPPFTETTTTTVIDRVEEHFPDKPASPTHNYYTAPPQTSPQGISSSVYKYSKETYNDRDVLLPKPFPTGTQMYPVNGKGPNNGQGPPKKLDDLMASFSDSEREVLVDIRREEKMQRKDRLKDNGAPKKEVEFVGHTPPQVQSKNVAGPPVYYPPGSGEFKMKEESSMVQGGGEWAKAKGAYEYEASSKSKQSQKSGKTVVPVCLPLCCALPCVIM
jgi:hypothetical protein